MLAKLDEWGLADNTVLIFMSDNGMAMRRLRDSGKGPRTGLSILQRRNQEGPQKLTRRRWRAACRFSSAGRGRSQAGRDICHLAAHIDILPTLAALAGAALPEKQVEGRSLLPLLEGKAADWSDRFIFNNICRWPLGADPDKFKDVNFSVRNQRFRYVGPKAGRRGAKTPAQLFDMEADPGQTTDVLAQHPEVAQRMRAAYEEYWQKARPLMVNENDPLSPIRPYWEWYERQRETIGIPDWKAPAL